MRMVIIQKPFSRVVSIFTVFINKALLSGEGVKLEAPIFIAWFQCVVSATICFILAQISIYSPHKFKFPSGNPFSMEIVQKVSFLGSTFN
jgi:GDP-fucose transporter C1